MNLSRRAVIRIMVRGTVLYTLMPFEIARAGHRYPETVAALKFLHGIELSVQHAYKDYAEQARADGYPGIGNLFRALSLAEEIHARNFKTLLEELDVPESGVLVASEVRDTKENLKKAIDTELYHIEMVYPESLEDIRDEAHARVIRFIDYAWQSEKMHRDLLRQMRSGMGFLFKMVAGRIEKQARKFYICTFCGSSLEKLPEAFCPVCSEPIDQYVLVTHGKPVQKVKELM